jgi:hypothetical protein
MVKTSLIGIPKIVPASKFPEADKILEEAKGRFPLVIVLGLNPQGQIDVTTNQPHYPTLQWLLNRAGFELLLHEKSTMNTPTPIEIEEGGDK